MEHGCYVPPRSLEQDVEVDAVHLRDLLGVEQKALDTEGVGLGTYARKPARCLCALGAEHLLETDGEKADGGTHNGNDETESHFLSPGLLHLLVLHAADGAEEGARCPEGDDTREYAPRVEAAARVVRGGSSGGGGACDGCILGGDEGDRRDTALWSGESLCSSYGAVVGRTLGEDGDVRDVELPRHATQREEKEGVGARP